MPIEQLVLGGERTSAADGGTFAVIEPATGKSFAEVAQAGTEDAERAVQLAHRAFEEGSWPRLSATQRGREGGLDLRRVRRDELLRTEGRSAHACFRALSAVPEAGRVALNTACGHSG